MYGILRRMDRWLSDHRPDVQDALGPPATDEDLDELLAGLRENGFPEARLPADLRAFLKWHTGLKEGCDFASTGFFSRRNPMQLDWIVQSHGIMLSRLPEEQRGFFNPAWVPVFDNSYSLLCVDALGTRGHKPGQVVFVDFKGGESRRIVAPDLNRWMRFFHNVLEHPEGRRYYLERDPELMDALWPATYEIESRLLREVCPGYPIERTVYEPNRARPSPSGR